MLNYFNPGVAIKMPPIWYTYNGNYNVTAALSATFTGVTFGPERIGRIICFCMATTNGTHSITSAKIGGVDATWVQQAGTNTTIFILYAVVPNGLTGNVEVSFSATAARQLRATSYSIYAAKGPIPNAEGTGAGGGAANRSSTIITTKEPNVIIAAVASDETLGTGAARWTGTSGVVQDYAYSSNPDGFSSASILTNTIGSLVSTRQACRCIKSIAFT